MGQISDRSGEAPPWPALRWLVAAGVALRLAFAAASESIHHPDEVFQYLEQAHRLVFGYGLVPWEFRFGARSWLLPLVISAPLALSKLLRVDDPAVYTLLVEGLFGALSAWLIVSAYRVGRNLVSEAAGRLAALFACFWYELVYFAPRPLPDVVSTYFLVAALAYLTDPPGRRRPGLFGLCVAAGLVIRVQYLPLAGLLLLVAAATWSRRALVTSSGAALGVVLLAGALDKLAWGGWFASYYNYHVFNLTHGISVLFGTQRPRMYVLQLAVASVGALPGALVLSLGFLRQLWLPAVWAVIVVGMHTLVPHKEYRFVFAALPALLVLAAAVTVLAGRGPAPARRALAPAAATSVLAVISAAGMLGLLPYAHAVYPVRPLYARTDELRAIALLRRETDLAGVLFRATWWSGGGYYHLHRDVPIYFAPHEEAMRRQGDPVGAYVSHVVGPASVEALPGFARIAALGALAVDRQLAPRAPTAVLPSYSRDVPQPGIDGVYRPTVIPRF
jgi:hypothetical protein